MSDDPVRWKDAEDAPAKVRGLLAHGRAVPPMPGNVRSALLAQLPAPAAPPAPGASVPPAGNPGPAASALGVPSAWVIGGVAVVAVAVAALALSARTPVKPRSPAVPSATAAPQLVATPTVPAPVETAPPAPSASAEPAETPRSSSAPRSPAAPAATGASPSASARAAGNLAEESALVGRARTNLASSPALALAAVDEHARRFPRGELAAEREYLRVSALRRLGRKDEARTHGQRYLTLFPTSPYTSAVRTILAELGDP